MRSFFQNKTFFYNGYNIGSLVIITVYFALIIPFPWICRKLYGIVLFILFAGSWTCIIFYFFRTAKSAFSGTTNKWDIFSNIFKDSLPNLTKFYLMVPFVSFGLLMNLMFTRQKLYTVYGVLISSFLIILWVYILQWVSIPEDPWDVTNNAKISALSTLEEKLLYLLIFGFYSAYLHVDAKMMISKRIKRY